MCNDRYEIILGNNVNHIFTEIYQFDYGHGSD